MDRQDKTIPLTATVQESPAEIALAWTAPTSGSYVITHQKIYRRHPGEAWGAEYAALATTDLSFTDTAVEPGVRYEYRIVRIFSNGPFGSTGFIQTGIRLPEIDRRGAVVLLVRDTAAAAMPVELTRLQEDLAGDGWQILREDVAGSDSVEDVKALITSHYNNPATPDVRSVFLFGRIPVPYSGLIAPDGHTDHVGAWPADVFYGEMDGTWTDTEVDNTAATGTRNDNEPGDGKYDQSVLPSAVELEVGRVDLSQMTIFPDGATSEDDLLLRYLDRDHDYRHGQGAYAAVPRRGLIDDHWGYRGEDTFASNVWWNYSSFFGPGNITTGDWFTTLETNSYLWAFGGGPGSYTGAVGVGTSAQFGTTDSKAIFCMMLGSYFGDWDNPNNFLRAPLAGTADGLGLANMWAGRPHWHIHAMAMGEPLGYGARQSQNNLGEYPTGFGAAQIHIALMGDPTLRLFPVIPASGAGQVSSAGQVSLSWTASADTDIQGYAIYRGASDARSTGIFSRVNGALVAGTSFDDLSAVPGVAATYMIRAVKLETSASGSYLNSSQGIFIDATPGLVAGPEISLSADNQPIQSGSTVPQAANETDFGIGEINVDTVTRSFTIRNDGATDLNLTGPPVVTLSGSGVADFSVTLQPAISILAPGASTTFEIEFSPTVLGARDAVVSLSSDDADEGTFTFAISGIGEPNPPDIDIPVTSFTEVLAPATSDTDTLTLDNNGLGNLDFTIASDYDFRDSDAPDGPTYEWIDISSIGTEITGWTGSAGPTDNGGSPSLPIGFNFPFYGSDYTDLIVSTEGFITFAAWVDAPSNAAMLPTFGAPANIIALYWDDLDLRDSLPAEDQGKVYCLQADPDTMIIQYEGVYQFSSSPDPGDERLSCQAILKSSGEIILQYKTVPTTEHYLVGIQNDNLDQGLTVAANSTAITDGMAVRILPPAEEDWFSLASSSGTVSPTSSLGILMTFDPTSKPFGDYFGRLFVRSNDPDTPSIEVDLALQGGAQAPEIDLAGNARLIPFGSLTPTIVNDTDFGEVTTAGPAAMRTYTVWNRGTAPLNLGSLSVSGSDFSIGLPGSAMVAPGASTTFDLSLLPGLPGGAYAATVTVPSDDANEPSFTFAVAATQLSSLESWRLGHFGDPANVGDGENDADPDGDGWVNLLEYGLGGDPLASDGPDLLPTLSKDLDDRIEFHFTRDSAKTDITYTVQASDTMGPGSWDDIASSSGGVATVASGAHAVSESGSPLVDVIVTDAVVAPTRRFFRLEVTTP